MSEIRIITSSDEHLCDQNPGFRKDNYRDSILKKLEWQGEFAKKFNANVFLRGGDFFHTKAANKTSHATVALSAQIHRNYSCPVYSIIGNHDITYNDCETISRQPLGVLFETNIFRCLNTEIITSKTLKVRVIGISYSSDLTVEKINSICKKQKDDVYTVAFIHALAAFSPEERIQRFFNETIFDYRDLVFDGCPDVYVFGHYHKDQGIQDLHGVKFVNLGAISRGALTFDNLERKPKICSLIFNSRGVSVEEHIVPHADASVIFDLEKKTKLEEERKSLDDFIKNLRKNAELSKSITARTWFDKFDWSQFDSSLKQTAIEILEAAEAGVLDE
jgi:DNA repair exonuclease SbcCD nuclease subunit